MPSIIPVRRIVLAGGAGVRTFAAWNSADKVNITLSDIDTKATNDGGGLGGVRSVTSHASGKWYFEFTVNFQSNGASALGIATSSGNADQRLGIANATSAGLSASSGQLSVDNGSGGWIDSTVAWAAGAIVGVAVDVGAHKIWLHKNGTYGNSGDPSTNTNGVDYITTAAVFACAHLRDALEAVTINTGGAAFSYSIPTGFAAWG